MLQTTCQLATAVETASNPEGSGNSMGLTLCGGPQRAVRFMSGGILKTRSWKMALDLVEFMVGGSKEPFLQQKGIFPIWSSSTRSGGRSAMTGRRWQLRTAAKSRLW
ncbi:unnamed protein product [Spirodela intermedia]|uniref:Uncharacterized protein n=1 Tax=Spirodela intermedia TaxID=51605 RepID=A0A7I8KBM0_SPIIN|nr:unnamed protein product [Spirodela intermedia]